MGNDIASQLEARYGLPMKGAAAVADPLAQAAAARALSHRSHRKFLHRPVEDNTLSLLLAAAFSAPSKSDLQQASVIVIRDQKLRLELAALVPSMPWIEEAPVFLVFLGDSRRIRKLCARRGKPFANDHLDAFFNAAADAAIVLQNMVTIAGQAGLGSCPISVLRNFAAEVSKLLKLPQHVFPFAGLCLGYPAQEGHISMRLPPAVTVHTDHYDDSDAAAQIEAYDRRRHQRYAIPQEKQRDRDLHDEVPLYGWSEDKARQVAKLERADFGRYVRDQGFCLD